mmetsp:Transcript_88197/g.274425  ORF Transcript_88197/g.274425 Transcript_88197/m.274425 type:complete len:252 (-) Transcript_88197:108-863(-)
MMLTAGMLGRLCHQCRRTGCRRLQRWWMGGSTSAEAATAITSSARPSATTPKWAAGSSLVPCRLAVVRLLQRCWAGSSTSAAATTTRSSGGPWSASTPLAGAGSCCRRCGAGAPRRARPASGPARAPPLHWGSRRRRPHCPRGGCLWWASWPPTPAAQHLLMQGLGATCRRRRACLAPRPDLAQASTAACPGHACTPAASLPPGASSLGGLKWRMPTGLADDGVVWQPRPHPSDVCRPEEHMRTRTGHMTG